MMIDPNSPIGLFDSGVGGLTVAKAIKTMLPNEQMIYFGDTAHLPYGDKSRDTIIKYSLEISEFLLKKGCKVILIACNSASSNAFEEVKMRIGNKALILSVIDPVIHHISNDPEIRRLGVIGTKATISSGNYAIGVQKINPQIEVFSLATPLLVPMIEEGFIFDDISNAIIRSYLSKPSLQNIDSLVLGCTHYPIIQGQIARFYDFNIKILDSSRIAAEELKNILAKNDLLASHRMPPHEFYVSDYTPNFEMISRMFFDEKIRLLKHIL